ncbi:MAG: BrnA antitoxin family protein [Proteobacteria bacterium]|nr:BrnA antitoxin family protein [Pseudomonadota bacterium]MBI3498733.1 BrnA antitoxin family protein [Pseudomonadota bacterium]
MKRLQRRRVTDRTDYEHLARVSDDAITAAVAADPDAAPIADEEWFRTAELVMPEPKVPISFRVDRSILDWFKKDGPGYQTRMNAVLKGYINRVSAKATATRKPDRTHHDVGSRARKRA